MGRPAKAASDRPTAGAARAVDFHAWAQQQSARLRQIAGGVPGLDGEGLAEEVAEIGISEHRALESQIRRLLAHLLKLHHQPEKATRCWANSVRDAHRQMLRILDRSPSLRNELAATLDEAHAGAVLDASSETGLPLRAFPKDPSVDAAALASPDFAESSLDGAGWDDDTARAAPAQR